MAAQPLCAGCHDKTDSLGLGLEAFDRLGAARTSYEDGTPIGEEPGELEGAPFTGLIGLADRLAADPRVPRCAARRAISYALGRRLEAVDEASVERITKAFQGGLTVRALLSAIVTDDVFRFRRGEGVR
jgi:hypothetical protein